ncbi:MAG: 30S ribosomal protein S12 methylthiotransferase RimO [Lachnospiraceae bacterium]|nr:30S ribosomal protein S12 methylthiotransferase RimO [Lachnospiraceae bacterium]
MQIMMISLGCDKNLVDTEMMLGQLAAEGFRFTDDETMADVIVVNTCCFIGDAKQESIDTLIEMGRLKEEGRLKLLIAAGCLAQRYHDEIIDQLPEVDVLLDTMAIDHIVKAIREGLASPEEKKESKVISYREPIDRLVCGKERVVTTGGHYAYLKIAEGCDKNCTYCVIPKVRGHFRSVPMETLVGEATKLADKGVRELILVAQETTLYGMDLYGQKCLPQLIEKLAAISGIYWIRLLYCYPEEVTEELADTFAAQEKLVHYIDLPIQHCSDRILKRMGRRTTKAELSAKIALLREKVPDICIRTTLITGFPSETEEEVNELADFIEQQRFDRLGVFTYSPEEGTPAAEFEEQIDEEEKENRRAYLMELQQQIAFEKAESMKGRVLTVLIEGAVADENAYVGRSYMDSPGIDGLIFVNTDAVLMTGDLARVKITGSYEYDLIGVLEDEDEPTQ